MNLAIVIRWIGPYHEARFRELSKVCNLTIIETHYKANVYKWRLRPTSDLPFNVIRISEYKDKKKVFFETLKNADILFLTGWYSRDMLLALRWANKTKIPTICFTDSNYEDEKRVFLKEWIKSLIINCFDSFVCAGSRAKAYLKRFSIHCDKITQPYDVVDNHYFNEAAFSRKPSSRQAPFLCVSRSVPKKNLSRLIAAYSQYVKEHDENITPRKLKIVGVGDNVEELEKLISNLNLRDLVVLVPFIQIEELRELYLHSHCLVLASLNDQWGLVVNEAMATGLPVLVSTGCGSSDDLVIETGSNQNGYKFNPYDIFELSKKLWQASNLKESEWQLMSRNSLKIINKYGLSNFCDACLDAAIAANRDRLKKTSFLSKIFLIFLTTGIKL